MWQLSLVSILIVLLGLFHPSYGFFLLLQGVVYLTAAVGFARALTEHQEVWLLGYGLVVVLYTPIFPVPLRNTELWRAVNCLTLFFFWIGVLRVRPLDKHPPP